MMSVPSGHHLVVVIEEKVDGKGLIMSSPRQLMH